MNSRTRLIDPKSNWASALSPRTMVRPMTWPRPIAAQGAIEGTLLRLWTVSSVLGRALGKTESLPIWAEDYAGDEASIYRRGVLLIRNMSDLISVRQSRHGLESRYFLLRNRGGPSCRPEAIVDGFYFVLNCSAGRSLSAYSVCLSRALL